VNMCNEMRDYFAFLRMLLALDENSISGLTTAQMK